MNEILTAEEVAKKLQFHPETIRRWLRQGVLKGTKAGSGDRHHWRVKRADLDAFMAERKVQ